MLRIDSGLQLLAMPERVGHALAFHGALCGEQGTG
jgi:hypothetical protein